MGTVSRRRFLACAAGAGACAVAPRARASPPVQWRGHPLPAVPICFGVATDDGQPVRDEAWIDAQVAEMESLFGPLGVHPAKASVRRIDARHAHMESRADRDALAAEVRPGVANVFIVGSLMDVDEPPRMRRGVHWRNRAHPSTRYVILAAEAMPTVLAHEMGHYFGNGHSGAVDNLMSYQRTGGPVFLDASQQRIIQEAARQAFASGELLAMPGDGG